LAPPAYLWLNTNHLRNFRSDNLSQDKFCKEIIKEQDKRKIRIRFLKLLEYKVSSLFFEIFCKCQNCYAMFWKFLGWKCRPWMREEYNSILSTPEAVWPIPIYQCIPYVGQADNVSLFW